MSPADQNPKSSGPSRMPAGEPQIIEPLCAVFRRALKKEGLKYTTERAQILDAIIRIPTLFDAERLIADLKRPGMRVSKATVYRTLKLMIDAGILQRVLFDEDHAHYQLVYGTRPQDLIIRVDTRSAIEIDAPELIALRERLCREHGLEARGHRFHVFAVGVSSDPKSL